MLGLAVRAAELNLAAYAIDLRGHGASLVSMDKALAADVETAIAYARRHGRVAAIGHSLGGRLALVSSADFALGISPALTSNYGPKTRAILGSLRDSRVRQTHAGVIFAALGELPPFDPRPERPVKLLYGSRDLPEICDACRGWAERGVPALEIENALHGDICLLERTFDEVVRTLASWFGIA
jgi:dienelactone hydrolase